MGTSKTSKRSHAKADAEVAAGKPTDSSNYISHGVRVVVVFFSIACLCVAGILSYQVRLFSVVRYGYLVHEFDPWFNYRATKYLSENGWTAFFSWFDRMSWYPIGRPVGTTIYPGLQLTAVGIHRVLSYAGLPMSIRNVCVLMPAWFSVVATMLTALLAYEVDCSLSSAAVAALTFCILPAHTMRSMAGEFDNECIAVAAMVATFYFWVRSLRTPASWPIGVMTGLAYGYMVASWGGYIFVLNMVALHAGVTAMVDWACNRYSSSLLKAYTLFFVVGTAIAVRVPPVGLSPFKSLEQLSAVLVFIFLVGLHISERMRVRAGASVRSLTCLRIRASVLCAILVLVASVAVALAPTGYFGPISSRVRALFVRHVSTGNPLVDSVAEHQPATSGAYTFFLNWVAVTWAAGFGVVTIWGAISASAARTFVVLYSLWAYYFSFRMSRLMLLTGPVACIATGATFGLAVELATGPLCRRRPEVKPETTSKRKNGREEKRVSVVQWVHGYFPKTVMVLAWACVLGVLYLLLVTDFIESNRHVAHQLARPHIVFEARIPDQQTPTGYRNIMVRDYLEAYQWLKQKTPKDARILAWWDYGYQITGIGDRTTLADGNTWNHEHIATIGKMLTSPIEEAHSLVRHMADYVLIWAGANGDDLRKSPHMARIGNSVYRDICPNDPLCQHFGFYDQTFNRPSKTMRHSLLYHLHAAGTIDGVVVPPNLFQEVYSSHYGLIRIFKVMNVSEESKKWVADPANHVCSSDDTWICPGQYPPAKEIQEMLSKRVDFSQIEDFNRGHKDDSYHQEYMNKVRRKDKW